MEKTISWNEPGREKLDLTVKLDGDQITNVTMKAVGCFDFLSLSQKMKEKLVGSIAELVPPPGQDHSSMIWREMIATLQEEWKLPFAHEELCHCRKVTTQKVDRAIVYGAHSVEEVRKRTSANTGCGTCKNDVQQLIGYRQKV